MATARKLPSGKWMCQVYIGMAGGKRKYKAFTGSTKVDAEYAAETFLRNNRTSSDPTVAEAISKYIVLKESVLSPSTIRGYQTLAKNAYDDIGRMRLSYVTTPVLQRWVSDHALRHKPKTTKNAYGLLTAAMKMFGMTVPPVTLPKIRREEYPVPTSEDLQKLLAIAGANMRKAIMLGAYCSLRRGEICALEYSDIRDGCLTVNKSMVRTGSGTYEIKQPKTPTSYRTIPVPAFVLEEIGTGDGRVVEFNVNSLTKQFERDLARAGVSPFPFHATRHFFASYLHAKGLPDAYIEKLGGWAPGSNVMKQIYRNVLRDELSKNNALMRSIFENMQSEMQSEI